MAWFKEAGGTEPLAKRMIGLDSLLANCEGKSVLDLGGAEGLIAREFVQRGAARAQVIDRMAPSDAYLGDGVWVQSADLNEQDSAAWFRGSFDIVLALAVAQKLKRPDRFLLWAASLGKTLAVRLPAETFHRKRDPGGKKYSAVEILKPVADLVDEPPSFEDSWLGIFEVRG